MMQMMSCKVAFVIVKQERAKLYLKGNMEGLGSNSS